AVVKPVLEVDLTALSASSVRMGVESVPAAEEAGLDLMKSIIGEETGAYILDKAAELGIPCQEVRVTCAVEENGVPYPESVVLVGPMSWEEREMLSRRIEADLAIPAERQTYESGGEEG
ncbi:MAG TPA: stage III sporulation protein AF, partial [Candidatus Intestinimonas merdavium]|nr:stage III sporulation protein AF [Candidatus Intestinimonas merdavium]